MHLPKKVLIAPLDWGLGHATRCMPIIDFFLHHNTEVHIASNGRALLLLQHTYPELQCHELPPYAIQYGNNNSAWKLLLQAPKVYAAIEQEHIVLGELLLQHSFDLIISDNRYGIYHPAVKSIFLCHQLRILPPENLRFTLSIFWNLHKSKIYNFDEIWIPDDKKMQWSGIMAHGFEIAKPHKYIGILSRFSNRHTKSGSIEGRITAILSGPEPQRSIFEDILLQQAIRLPHIHFTIVRGITEHNSKTIRSNMTIIDHLTTNYLASLISESEVIIARPGYSTVMDMIAMEKKTILIPTPGQTEQEYLAAHLRKKNMAIVQNQEDFDLKSALQNIANIENLHQEKGTDIDAFLSQYFGYTH